MAGRFIAVVGPSGVGKDSVMAAYCARHPEVLRARRVITRSAEALGEQADSVSETEFQTRVATGQFTLHWSAHGLHYGIPRGVEDVLAEGRDVMANLSRSVLGQLPQRFARSVILQITAPTAVLAQRLARRDREPPAEQARRLERADFALPEGLTAIKIRNDGPLEATLDQVDAALRPERA